MPDWLGNFQNREFPHLFAEYAQAFARRYPQFTLWTPVNEPLVTALFSAKYGWWNERLTTDAAFVRATLNIAKASVLAMQAIQKEIPDAVFVHSESCEYTHPSEPRLQELAAFHNERRFLPMDLILGRLPSRSMCRFLSENGARDGELSFFVSHANRYTCVLGTDYYVTNEHWLKPDGQTESAGEMYGYYVITKQYHDRYRLPLMHTETNLWEKGDDAVRWLRKQWHCLMRLHSDGVPVVGFTWFSLTDQLDWDTALREDAGQLNPVGLFDLDRKIRRVGSYYRDLARTWQGSLAVADWRSPPKPALHRVG